MSKRRTFVTLVLALSLAGAATGFAAVTVPIGGQSRNTIVYKPGDGVTLPVVVSEKKPRYTPEAMRARIQGRAQMEIVVQQDGTVGEVRVTKSLDKEFGLDDEAVAAARLWRFKPGTKDGKPVNVRVTVEMTFTLKK